MKIEEQLEAIWRGCLQTAEKLPDQIITNDQKFYEAWLAFCAQDMDADDAQHAAGTTSAMAQSVVAEDVAE